ncbi:MAG: ADP-ribosylglycohydrolase family protein [Peptococcaceae bacterium]|jgi:ADP-ribosylglycohydrolase|nr:ADP-ribosylglycohydrolase family protein [Peptococcaceae bacterium]
MTNNDMTNKDMTNHDMTNYDMTSYDKTNNHDKANHDKANYDKILGCILGAAVGDAMGAATECQSSRQIERRFGGRVTGFRTPPDDSLAAGRQKAQVTDAFSIPYTLTNHLIKAKGAASAELARDALREWGASEWFAPFAGMTTRKVVKSLGDGGDAGAWAYAGHLGNKLYKSHYYALSSNGAAVKAYPAALLHPGRPQKAVEAAVEMTMASHDDIISLSAAAAMAAAISRAFDENCSVWDMVEAALWGAELGSDISRGRSDALSYPGPSLGKRLRLAVQLGVCHGADAMGNIRDLIGSGPSVTESVPAAFGLLVANQGATMAAILDGVNIGDETAAIASLTGALCGALRGSASIPQEYLDQIDRANGFDLRKQAADLRALQ